MQSNRQVLEATYSAFNAHDIPAAPATMHPDVDCPNGMEGGRVRGHDGVCDYWNPTQFVT